MGGKPTRRRCVLLCCHTASYFGEPQLARLGCEQEAIEHLHHGIPGVWCARAAIGSGGWCPKGVKRDVLSVGRSLPVCPQTADILSARRHVSNVPGIGIGGSLAAPPLPHHRTYGSVYGGSRSYANALRSNDSTRVGWAFGFIRRQERFDVFPSRLPGFTLRRR